MPLRAQETHWDEFAAAFGFLEESDDSYIRGKYGLVSAFLVNRSDTEYFNQGQALKALFLYALLERHGDFVVPALQIAGQSDQKENDRFLEEVRLNLRLKLNRAAACGLPRNAAYHAMDVELQKYAAQWSLPFTTTRGPAASSPRQLAKPLSEKTLSGYYDRTLSYLEEVKTLERRGSNKNIIVLTEIGKRLLSGLEDVGIGRVEQTEVPPSFETIHDAFSIERDKYDRLFTPPITQGAFERVIMSALLPDKPLIPWKRHEEDFKERYMEVVQHLGERLSSAARLDVVRLALFTYSIGKARAAQFDDSEGDLNANLVVDIARQDPSRYILGHARTGRRFWSVAFIRR